LVFLNSFVGSLIEFNKLINHLTMEFLYLIAGAVFGAVAIFFAIRSSISGKEKLHLEDISKQEIDKQEAIGQLDKEKSIIEERYKDLHLSSQGIRDDLEKERTKNEELNNRITRAEVEYANLREKLTTHHE